MLCGSQYLQTHSSFIEQKMKDTEVFNAIIYLSVIRTRIEYTERYLFKTPLDTRSKKYKDISFFIRYLFYNFFYY